MSVVEEKGNISIHTENIFPIIKKFLYSDHEIFLRELVSNAVDALQKLKRLSSNGEFSGEVGEPKVEVSVDAEAKTITIKDNGIGMTAEEIKKYINQIAFSGASEFLEKYKGEDKGQIIGQFGLGFYSAFMVSKEVEIDTLSWKEGAEPALWRCDGSTEFSIGSGTRTERGTTITLHVSEDSEEFLDTHKLRTIISKYFKFIPTPIEIEGEKVNTGEAIWAKSPSDLTEEDYKKFYRELYPMSGDPLFWIHLNVDFPFSLTGVLYFPKVDPKMEVQKDKINLYSRQVFITDEVKDVVPEFLMLLHGVLDSPDIPLNVSRSFLQADGNVKKINSHITKKVADKLGELFRDDRASYEQKWQDIGVFVKYGMLTDTKFNDRAKDFCLVRNTEGQFFTFEEYKEKVQYNQKDKDENSVWLYTSNEQSQQVYIDGVKKRDYDVLVLDHVLDNHFVSHIERVVDKITIKRVDGESPDKLIDKGLPELDLLTSEQKELATATFKAALNNDKLDVKIENLTAEDLPVSLTQSEQMRRMRDMYKAQGMGDIFGAMDPTTLVVNANHPLVNKMVGEENEVDRNKLAAQLYDLALLSQGKLSGKNLSEFVNRSLAFLNN